MATKRQRKTSVPRALTVVPAEAEDAAPLDMVEVHVTLAFRVDGAPAFQAQFQAQMPRLPADQNAMQLNIGLDGRLLAQMLAPHVGATPVSDPGKPGKLWTPGTPHS